MRPASHPQCSLPAQVNNAQPGRQQQLWQQQALHAGSQAALNGRQQVQTLPQPQQPAAAPSRSAPDAAQPDALSGRHPQQPRPQPQPYGTAQQRPAAAAVAAPGLQRHSQAAAAAAALAAPAHCQQPAQKQPPAAPQPWVGTSGVFSDSDDEAELLAEVEAIERQVRHPSRNQSVTRGH